MTDDRDVHQAARALARYYGARKDEIPDEHPASPAVKAVMERLPGALADIAKAPFFAVTASHFEAYGMRDALVASPEALAALEARDELPPDE